MKRFFMKNYSALPIQIRLVIAASLIALLLLFRFYFVQSPSHEDDIEPNTSRNIQSKNDLSSTEDLDITQLQRNKNNVALTNLFSVLIPPPPPLPIVMSPQVELAPPQPVAPPLPFRFLGRLIDHDRTVVFVAHDSLNFSLHLGDTVENLYRVEAMDENQMTFVYLPLDERQTLNMGRPN